MKPGEMSHVSAAFLTFPLSVPCGAHAVPRRRGYSPRCSATAPSSQIYFATCARGLGTLLAEELQSPPINAPVTHIHSSGVYFESNEQHQPYLHAVRACLHSRLSTRLLHLLALRELHQHTCYESVYQFVKDVFQRHVRTLLLDGRLSFRVQARVAQKDAINERLAATAARDAILDGLRAARCQRPPRPQSYATADVPLFLAISPTEISLYRDMVGDSLHKRSFRTGKTHIASLNECIAAAMLRLARFESDSEQVVMDPMCGSGTILTEACMVRLKIPPAWFRRERFSFCRWADDHLVELLRRERQLAQAQIRDASEMPTQFIGCDVHEGAVHLAMNNVNAAGMDGMISVTHEDASEVNAQLAPHLVLCNPPWGERLRDDDDDAWRILGSFLRRNAGAGNTAVLLSGDRSSSRALRMKARLKVPVRVGDVDARVLVYDVLAARNGRL
ncbi:unnamed protein product [Agarophyton chilense]